MAMNDEIRLQPLDRSVAPQMAELANNIRVWQQLRDVFPHPYSLDDATAFIEGALARQFGLVLGIWYGPEFAGTVGLVPQPDVYRRTAEIGYWLGEPYWGRGIATEAVRQIVAVGFSEQPELVRIQAGIFSSNPASMRVLAKNGFQPEGISPNAIFKNGVLLDEHRYGLLRTP
ncbi:N-acetyltransferase [Fibrisoma montanum]|uniref:N-acetyltransferase n=2 Tax=Fibrisoma montanum TaxID=2305895 RepID=A0A418MHX1_9BACT|nr:N-acetyltransferase [Fibrisoma montanum]